MKCPNAQTPLSIPDVNLTITNQTAALAPAAAALHLIPTPNRRTAPGTNVRESNFNENKNAISLATNCVLPRMCVRIMGVPWASQINRS